MTTNLHAKATLYMADLWGYDRIEACNVTWGVVKYAQYPHATKVEYTIRGKRKRLTAVITTLPFVILDGWNHPDPPPKFGPPEGSSGVRTTRRLSCDPEWQTEFDAFLYGYLQGSQSRVVLDLRTRKQMEG